MSAQSQDITFESSLELLKGFEPNLGARGKLEGLFVGNGTGSPQITLERID